MNDAHFERIFDAAFDDSAKKTGEIPTLDHRSSWLKVKQRLDARRRKRNLRARLAKLSVVAAAILIGAGLFGNDKAVRAIEPLYATLKEYPSGLMSFFFGRSADVDETKAKTAPPPDFLAGLESERLGDTLVSATVSPEQAERLLSFPMPEFRYLPTGYTLDNLILYFYDDRTQADQAYFSYYSEEETYLTIMMQKMKPNSSLGVPAPSEGVSVEKIQLGDVPAILTTTITGTSTLEIISDGVHFSAVGELPAEELIRVYKERY
ncbi:DUF4367 domain-containing protein [Paenibacillaceae bacterium WGS1546]|uniref:DUF4367 domain-containing protein n=1 Tax=Cohnella sp. WGS1546 TaxID=3366810 RepID=UPI00372D7B55